MLPVGTKLPHYDSRDGAYLVNELRLGVIVRLEQPQSYQAVQGRATEIFEQEVKSRNKV